MLNVMFTVDVEVWCGGWNNLDAAFPGAFKRYVYGPTRHGDAGLPLTLKLLKEHNLLGVFFVEPLFATRFGQQYLDEVVGLIQNAGGEVQLHLHTEWINESKPDGFAHVEKKRQFISDFTLAEQTRLFELGSALLKKAGVKELQAFRAGSCRFNAETLNALSNTGIKIDSSYDAAMHGELAGITKEGALLNDVVNVSPVVEFPITVFKDGRGHLRHAQLGACSFEELRELIDRSAEENVECVTMLSHNFEMMSRDCTKLDRTVVRRAEKLFRHIADNHATMQMVGYRNCFTPKKAPHRIVNVSKASTAKRFIEQLVRRVTV